MQPTLPPPRWWWEAQEKYKHWGDAGPDSLTQFRLDRVQRLRDLQQLIARQKLQIPDILLFSPSKFSSSHQQQLHELHAAAGPTLSWNQRKTIPWEMTNFDKAIEHLENLNEGGHFKMDTKMDEQGMLGSSRGWVAGALLLLGLLIFLRVTDRCILRPFARAPISRSGEDWMTPHVEATRHQDELAAELNLVDSNLARCVSSDVAVDLPPPYTACANKNDEPPPPYSACYTSNPKDGQSVRLYDGLQQIIEGNHNLSQGHGGQEAERSHNRFKLEQTSTGDHVTVNIAVLAEHPSASTSMFTAARLAPIASRELSLDSDTSVNATTAVA